MDGITPIVQTGERFTHEFEARPFGLSPYHCHVMPLKRPREKMIVVDLPGQSLWALEGQREVYRARISPGANYCSEDGVPLLNGTPEGAHPIWPERLCRHRRGGTIDAGYDVPGVGGAAYFASNGAALHSTYWHNDLGIPKSHGCLNCRPADARWLFRWTAPDVPSRPGHLTVNRDNRGTTVALRGAG